MKYRTKLFLVFSGLLAISTFIALAFSYHRSHSFIFNKLRSQLTTVAAASAATFDGEWIATFNSKESTQTPDYQKLLNQLREIRDSNRSKGLYLSFVYIVKAKPDRSFYFIADGEEDPKEVSLFGDSFNEISELKTLPTQAFCVENEIKDQWGVWFSAYAPIYNDDSSVEAYLGIDKKALFLHTELDSLLGYYLVGFVFTLIIGSIVIHYLSKSFTRQLSAISCCVDQIEQGNLHARVEVTSKNELGELGKEINSMASEIEEKERITLDFGRYVSKHVLENILKSTSGIKLEGEKKKVTIVFSDIRQFTKRSESLAPEKVVAFLNEYFESMIEIIFRYHGTIDKFIGDALLAEFGIPEYAENQEELAVQAALEMLKKTKLLSQKWKGTSYEDLKIGIGIHTGEAVVGNIGTSFRMEYTAIGDTVNTAMILEALTKEFKKEILLSDATYAALKVNEAYTCESLGSVPIPGRAKPLTVYSLTSKKESV